MRRVTLPSGERGVRRRNGEDWAAIALHDDDREDLIASGLDLADAEALRDPERHARR
jgi:hypothetical protein